MIFDGKYSPDFPCRWKSYGTYRLLLLMFLLNEMSTLVAPAKIAHGAFFVQALIHILTVIFMGIPLIYSEICVAQYTNCSLISMWNFFPLFRGLGYGMVFSIILRTMYLNCLASWYLIYTFYSALDPPPWISCDYFDFDTYILDKCMVKKVNISTFQHVLDVYTHKQETLAMYTASWWFFETTIGENNTYEHPESCFFQWQAYVAAACINCCIFLLAIKKEKFLQIGVKIAMFYVGIVLVVLVLVALSQEGSWDLSDMDVDVESYDLWKIIESMKRSFQAMGCGSGMVVYLSHDASFRSPATKTAIITSLFGCTICLSFSLILFSGIRTMVYFHGGEQRILEQGNSFIYQEMGSASEILSYLTRNNIWTFLWFSSVFSCLFLNIWLCYGFLNDLVFNNFKVAKKYNNLFRFIIKFVICIFSCPFLCSDMFESLVQANSLIALITSFCFSISLYWIYGCENHSIDITFMIGVKSSMYWKIAWGLNPIFLIIFIYQKTTAMYCQNNSHILDENDDVTDPDALTVYWVILYTLIGLYAAAVTIGILFELLSYRHYRFHKLSVTSTKWGPRDAVLYKSRKMFMPQIMTTEFLYRQVRISGYKVNKGLIERRERKKRTPSEDLASHQTQWSALTSN